MSSVFFSLPTGGEALAVLVGVAVAELAIVAVLDEVVLVVEGVEVIITGPTSKEQCIQQVE